MSQYIEHKNVTKELLDTIKVGDLIKINDWKKPMRVKGVSENYFVMTQKNFRDTYYSVCEKKPYQHGDYNNMREGMFHCSTDSTIFGCEGFEYYFNDTEGVKKYLKAFEDGEIKLSQRRGIAIISISIKKRKN